MSKRKKGFWELLVTFSGYMFLGYAAIVMVILFIMSLRGSDNSANTNLLNITFGLLSVGLGCIAIRMSMKSDKWQAEILRQIADRVINIPNMFRVDLLTFEGKTLVKEVKGQQSKEQAQKRLEADTNKLGYVRGEVFQTSDGNWAIAWGGKYPL